MSELENASNPEAVRAQRQHHERTMARHEAELQDHVMSRMESLDEQHETLEYARQRCELLTSEARAVLTATAHVAGEYDCALTFVYGEVDLTPIGSNQVRTLLRFVLMLTSTVWRVTKSSLLLALNDNWQVELNFEQLWILTGDCTCLPACYSTNVSTIITGADAAASTIDFDVGKRRVLCVVT